MVKSRGGERCGNAGTRFRQARSREASASEPLGAGAKGLRDEGTVGAIHIADRQRDGLLSRKCRVQKSLERVPGVAKVTVSFKNKTAVVTYDDRKVDLKSLTTATTNAGYPSAPKS